MNNSYQQILVLGLGRSGLAATRLLQQAGAVVTVADSGHHEGLQQRAESLRREGISVYLGENVLEQLFSSSLTQHHPVPYQRAILSPGIGPSSSFVQGVIAQGIPLIGELELAYDFCQCPIVAITGTNGKTTTTELTVAGLQGAGVKTIACGNIGLPFSEAVINSADLDVIVLEVSSFQLETVDRFHADIAVWLNLSPNHLDRYKSMFEYQEAKLRIFRHQTAKDVMIVPKSPRGEFSSFSLLEPGQEGKREVNCRNNRTDSFAATQLTFSSLDEEADFYFDGTSICYHQQPLLAMTQTQLRGAHNAENMMAAFAIGVALGLTPQQMIQGISEYRSLPHRCEVVKEYQGVLWINDSKSTTLDAMEKAIHSVEKERPLILIAGGKNKGSSFAPIFPLVQERVREAILLGEMKSMIADSWKGIPSYQVQSLEEAVKLAAHHASAGDVVLFSPGTSSYDMFKNYEERGNHFKASVQQLFNVMPEIA